jgi:ATP-dependent protease Clp ATPase subunit
MTAAPRCGFCGRSVAEVRHLLQGEAGVHICDGCVERAHERIQRKGRPRCARGRPCGLRRRGR